VCRGGGTHTHRCFFKFVIFTVRTDILILAPRGTPFSLFVHNLRAHCASVCVCRYRCSLTRSFAYILPAVCFVTCAHCARVCMCRSSHVKHAVLLAPCLFRNLCARVYFVCLFVCVQISVPLFVCLFVCVHISVPLFVCLCVCRYRCLCLFVCLCVCIYRCLCLFVCACADIGALRTSFEHPTERHSHPTF
jgi:hypothetical protein